MLNKNNESWDQLKRRHQNDYNNHAGIFFAVTDKSFAEGLKKFGVTEKDIYSIGAGGFIIKSEAKSYIAMNERHDQEKKAFRKNEKALVNAIVSELLNHEYCISYDVEPALNSIGLDVSDVPKKLLKRATKKALELSEVPV